MFRVFTWAIRLLVRYAALSLFFVSVSGQGIELPVAPVAYQFILEPGIGQFREFEPRRVHTRIISLGLFSRTN